MTTFFVACAVLGGLVVLLQSVFGIFEGGDADHAEHAEMHDALDLISLRSVSAGICAFGIAGGTLNSMGIWWIVTLPAAALAGFAVMWAVAMLIRQMGRLEQDSSLVLEGAVGEPATVYIPIPAGRAGKGKVTVILQGQSIELEAVTDDVALPTGTSVTITGLDGATALVARSPIRLEGAS